MEKDRPGWGRGGPASQYCPLSKNNKKTCAKTFNSANLQEIASWSCLDRSGPSRKLPSSFKAPLDLLFHILPRTRLFTLFGQGAVLGGRTPPSPIQEGPFPQSSCPPRGESKAIIGLKPAILVPSGYPPPCTGPCRFPLKRRILVFV